MASKSKKLAFATDIFEKDIEGIIRKIQISEITPAATQPRTHFDDSIQSLAESIQAEGLLQPIVVTKEGIGYKIIAGERRYRAMKLLGKTEIECRILRKDAKDTYRLAVVENLQRENLDPIDEARAFRKLKQDYGHNDAELAKIVGKSRNYVNEILSVADIPSAWIERAKTAGIESKNFFIQFAQAVKAGTGDHFLDAFKSGAVTSVAAAKEFNKATKVPPEKPKKAALASNSVNDITYSMHAQGNQWSISIAFGVQAPLATAKQQLLEQALIATVKKQLK